MRMLHIADVHSGKTLAQRDLTEDLRHVLGQVVEVARDRAVDVVLVAGDLYDSASPSARAMETVDAFLSAMADIPAELVVIPGNHDSAERVAYAGAVLGRQGIHMAPTLRGLPRPLTLTDRWGEVDLWPIPFVSARTIHGTLGLPGEGMAQAFQALIDALPIDRGRRNVCISHQFVAGPTTLETADELRVGNADAVSLSSYDPFDYVALGHIHGPQDVGSPRVRYAGSPLKYGVREASRAKTMTLVEMDGEGAVTVEEIPYRPLHDLRQVRGPLAAVTDPTIVSQAPADDYVMVELTDPGLVLDALERLRGVYPNLVGFRYADLAQGEAPDSLEVQGAGEPLSLPELFEEFHRLQLGTEMDEASRTLVSELLGEAQVI